MEFLITNKDRDHAIAKFTQMYDAVSDRTKKRNVTLRVEMVENRAIRSIDDNRRYWGYITGICLICGETKERLDLIYRLKFLPDEQPDGTVLPGPHKDLLEDEFRLYLKKVRTHAQEFFGFVPRIPEEGMDTYVMWERMQNNEYNKMFRDT